MARSDEPISRYDPELAFDDSVESAHATMEFYCTGDYVRYEDHVESHRFVDNIEQAAFQRWFNEHCLSENWSQQTRDLYWEVWKAAIQSKEVQCQA